MSKTSKQSKSLLRQIEATEGGTWDFRFQTIEKIGRKEV